MPYPYKIQAQNGIELEGNTIISGSVTASLGISLPSGYILDGTASYAITASHALNAGASINTSSFAITGSNTFVGNQIISGSLTVFTGSAVELQVTNTGVTIGNIVTDTHRVTGSLNISGSTILNGNLIVSGNTTIGDATTDTVTLTASTMSLGSGTGILNIDSNTFVVDGANNRVGILKNNPSTALDVNGNTILSGSLTFSTPSSPGYNGEIARFGSGTLTTGQLYFYSSSGTWSLANANSTGSSVGMLGLALGSSPTSNGLLIRGYAVSSSYNYGTGSIVYMATSSGAMTSTSPSSSNHVVRVMGYQISANTMYFDPDKTWVTLA